MPVELATSELPLMGVRTFVRTGGPTDGGEAVIFVHGNPGSSEDFAELQPYVAEFARTIAPDLPGFGRSERPSDFSYTVNGFAHHLDLLTQAVGVARTHLVLHDFGGPWGLAWAAAHPARLASLVLINVGVLPGYGYHKYAWLWRTPVVGELSLLLTTRAVFKLSLNADNPKPLPDAVLDRMYEQWDRGTRRAVLSLYRATSAAEVSSLKHGETLAPYRVPALVVWGAGDPNIPVRYAREQQRFFDARVHVIEGAGHWPMIDEPEQTRRLVLDFLRTQLGASSTP